MALFGKKNDSPEQPQDATPVNHVLGMRQQGMSNSQIIQSLQRMGFKSFQIFDAMNQADLKTNPQGTASMPDIRGSSVASPVQQNPGSPMQQPMPVGQQPIQQQAPLQPTYSSAPYAPVEDIPFEESTEETADYVQEYEPEIMTLDEQTEKIEEIAEAIIDEKWDELIRNVSKIVEWKERSEQKSTALEQQIRDLKDGYENLQKAVVGKIAEYDQNLTSVGTEIKAMEKVFQKILPTLTDNVAELSKLTDTLRKTDVSKLKK